jgi:transcription initiation factor TFIIIB Brf1 subunit/transcription initiation factor TFIIB
MRIVKSLNETTECPNCGSKNLVMGINDYERMFILCEDCHEEVYENEFTCSEEQHAVYCVKKTADAEEEWLNQKRKEKENFIFEMREEISNLTWSISNNDIYPVVLVENIQNILNRIIDYIEEN